MRRSFEEMILLCVSIDDTPSKTCIYMPPKYHGTWFTNTLVAGLEYPAKEKCNSSLDMNIFLVLRQFWKISQVLSQITKQTRIYWSFISHVGASKPKSIHFMVKICTGSGYKTHNKTLPWRYDQTSSLFYAYQVFSTFSPASAAPVEAPHSRPVATVRDEPRVVEVFL